MDKKTKNNQTSTYSSSIKVFLTIRKAKYTKVFHKCLLNAAISARPTKTNNQWGFCSSSLMHLIEMSTLSKAVKVIVKLYNHWS